jgi:glycosyltransferase involved in cell wall biosynthesis
VETVKYSIVIPIFNEEATLPALVKRLTGVMAELDGPSEVVLVDDGSKDSSYRLMTAINATDSRFKIIQFSRNFGHQIAITAGMDAALGQAVVVMDADLQDPPEVILQLVAKWKEGYEVVYAVRERREGETLFKKASASAFYGMQRRLAEIDQPAEVGDFRLVDRKALDAFLQMRERNRYVRGMFSWVGFRQTAVPYTRASRAAGESNYTMRRMTRLALDGFVGFSTAPLRLSLTIGLLLSVGSLLYGIVAIVLKLAGVISEPGYASLLVSITFLSGVQLIVIGMVGQYVARIYDEARARPLYLVQDARGFEAVNRPADPAWAPATQDFLARGQAFPPGPAPASQDFLAHGQAFPPGPPS